MNGLINTLSTRLVHELSYESPDKYYERDIPEAREFYENTLGFTEGRSDDTWVDYNMFGYRFVCHLNPGLGKSGKVELRYNPVDKHQVPIPHAGVVLEMDTWQEFSENLKSQNIEFIIEPYI